MLAYSMHALTEAGWFGDSAGIYCLELLTGFGRL